jgi:conjugative relaxase-like TrwC/TraI family protein
MLTIQVVKSASYYTDQTQLGYYVNGGAPPGRWWGEGAKLLSLGTLVDAEQFALLFRGLDSQGTALVQNASAANRQGAWDLTCLADKSVAQFINCCDPLSRRIAIECHDRAVSNTLHLVEKEIVRTRRGKEGRTLETAHLVAATFRQYANRDLDPLLHTHAVLLNLCVRHDGTTGTIVSQPLFENKMTLGAYYRAELASLLERELGLRIECVKGCFRIAGIPETLRLRQSQRRQEILAALQSNGYFSAKAAEVAALDTRKQKDEPPLEQLLTEWRAVSQEHGFGLAQAQALLGQARPRDHRAELAETIRAGCHDLLEEQSHWTEMQLLGRACVAHR